MAYRRALLLDAESFLDSAWTVIDPVDHARNTAMLIGNEVIGTRVSEVLPFPHSLELVPPKHREHLTPTHFPPFNLFHITPHHFV